MEIFHSDLEKRMRKTVELFHIIAEVETVMNLHDGFISLSQATATLITSMIVQPTSFVNSFSGM